MRHFIAACLMLACCTATAADAPAAKPAPAEPKKAEEAKPDAVQLMRDRIAGVNSDSQRISLRVQLATLLQKAGRKDEAIKELVDLAVGSPAGNAHAMSALHNLFRQDKEIPAATVVGAVLTVMRATKDSALHHRWSTALRQTMHARGQKEAYEPALKAAAKAKPDDAMTTLALGYVLYADRRYADAVPHLEAAFKALPEDATLRGQLAQALITTGNHARALELYLAVIKASETPTTNDIYQAATCYAMLGQTDNALAFARKLEAYYPDTNPAAAASTHYLAASVYVLLNRANDVDAASKRSLELARKSGVARTIELHHYYRVYNLVRANMRDVALTEAKQFLDDGAYTAYRRQVLRYLHQMLPAQGADDAAKHLEADLAAMGIGPEDIPRRRWRLEELARLYTETAQYRNALRVHTEMKALDPRLAKTADRQIAQLKDHVARMESGTAALLDSEGALWRAPDSYDRTHVWVAFKNRLIVVDQAEGRHHLYKAFFGYDEWTPYAVLFRPDFVWLGTDRGLFTYDRAKLSWQRRPIDAQHMEVPVIALEDGPNGAIVLTVRGDNREKSAEKITLPAPAKATP